MKLLPIHGNFLKFFTNFSHLHPLQVETCDSNSWLVVDEDDNGKFRLERVNLTTMKYFSIILGDQKVFFQFEIINLCC